MASIQSLGTFEPSAIHYLLSESILPTDPPPSAYTWKSYSYLDQRSGCEIQEEIVVAGNYVTWSQGGSVKRTFNLGSEGESVLHAFATVFQNRTGGDATHLPGHTTPTRALVVILRTQVHIFLLSGETYLFPLSFEVASAFPCPFGFIVQRQTDGQELVSRASEQSPATIHEHDLSTINESFSKITGSSARPSLILPDLANPQKETGTTINLPRTYSLTEILAEFGVVVASTSRKPHSLDDCHILPIGEELLYISPGSELQNYRDLTVDVCIAVTYNQQNSAFTVWHVSQEPDKGLQKSKRRERTRPSELQRRKSTQPQTQANNITSTFRASGIFRESHGGRPQTSSEGLLFNSSLDAKQGGNDLAAQLGPEFGDVGVQTRSARRVSSMLARTDLGTGADHSTFNELAAGQAARRSMMRSVRRGESIGSFSDRQSLGFKPRSSFAPNASFISNGTSFLDVPGRESFGRFDNVGEIGGDADSESELDSDLPRHLGFFKIRSLIAPKAEQLLNNNRLWRIVVLQSPQLLSSGQNGTELAICILEKNTHEITIVRILVKFHSAGVVLTSCELKATEIRHGSSILDISRIQDGTTERLLMLTQSRLGYTLQLESPWGPPYRIELPSQFVMFNPRSQLYRSTPEKKRDTGINRTIPSSEITITSLGQSMPRGQLLIEDSTLRTHALSIRLRPQDSCVEKILTLCGYVLGPSQHDSLLVAWWEVSKWIKSTSIQDWSEWTAVVVVLFVLAVPFLDDQRSKIAPAPRRKKGGILRSSSGIGNELEISEILLARNNLYPENNWILNSAWNWLGSEVEIQANVRSPTRHSRHKDTHLTNEIEAGKKNTFLMTCVSLARDFVQTPNGENALGPEGYLPTAMSKSRELRSTALAKILVALHLLYEEMKLDVLMSGSSSSSACLIPIMAQLGVWLGWIDWTIKDQSYFAVEMKSFAGWIFDESAMKGLDVRDQPFEPPSIFQHIEDCVAQSTNRPFLTLLNIVGSHEVDNQHFMYQNAVSKLTPRTTVVLKFLNSIAGSRGVSRASQSIDKAGIKHSMFEVFPDGFAAVFWQALASSRSSCLSISSMLDGSSGHVNPLQQSFGPLTSSHEAGRDFHTLCNNAVDTEILQRWDVSSETARHTITRLLFKEDRRFQEASKLVNQTRPPVVECTPQPDWSESDLLEAQKELAQHVTRRTLAVSSGRGMMHFNARFPLVTERVPIPAFSLQCMMQPRNSNDGSPLMTFSADKAAFTEEKVCWAFFHNGVSAGLMISKCAQGVDTSWIMYNKPPELTNRHAGFLLALGLNGHLKTLARWVAFKYLTPKHTMTSVGLLLGLSASHLGTMDTLITRLLSVHVTRLLPPGAAELNLSSLTQTTGIMGIGLLYLNSQHRRMSEVMLSEIENGDAEEGAAEDTALRDEGYRLAAGFSLGLINLGQGKNLHGLHDMNLLERLLAIAIGTKNVNLVHVLDRATAGAVMATALIFLKTNDASVARKIDIPDTLQQFDYVRPDVFLLRTLAKHLVMWSSIEANIAFIRKSLPAPYRSRAELISTKYLSTEDLPFFNIMTGICLAIGLRYAGSQQTDARDLLVAYLDQFLRLSKLSAQNYDARVTLNSVNNNLNVLALACATVMAGSGDLVVMRRLRALHGRTDKDTPFGSHLAAHMALGTLFLAGGTATFGTSNLAVASLCIAFYPLFPTDVLDNRCHLQALRHLWVLAVEHRCLVVRDLDSGNVIEGATASIRLKNDTVKVIQCPGLLPEYTDIGSVDIKAQGYWQVSFDLTHPKMRETIERNQGIDITLQRQAAYDKPTEDIFVTEFQALNDASGIPSVDPNSLANVAPKPSFSSGKNDQAFDWVFEQVKSFTDFDHAERQLVSGVSQVQATKIRDGNPASNKWLDTTAMDSRLEFERGILPGETTGSSNVQDLSSPATISTQQSQPLDRDKLWQLRLLFAWWDRWDKEDAEVDERNFQTQLFKTAEPRKEHEDDRNGSSGAKSDMEDDRWASKVWLRREVVDRLKLRVWNMMNEVRGDA